MLERLRKKYPEDNFEEDEAIFGRINDDYDQYDQELSGMREREGALSDIFTSDPRAARLMMDWRKGDDPAVALVRLYGQDIEDAIHDPDKQEAIAEANREYMSRVAQEKEYEEQYTSNLAESLQNLEAAQAEYGLSDEQVDNTMRWLIGIAKDAMMGRFAPETIAMAIKAQNYDTDIEQARTEGEVRGKNAKIRETLRKRTQGDGTAPLGGKHGEVTTAPTRRKSIFDLAAEAK